MSTFEDRIVEEAKTWIGVRYKDKGRDRYGVDCLGLVIKVAHSLGVSDFDTIEYPRRPSSVQLINGLRQHMTSVPVDQADHGDIAVFRGPNVPVHVGILERDEDGQFWVIHAFAPAHKVVRDRLAGERDDKMVFAFRYVLRE